MKANLLLLMLFTLFYVEARSQAPGWQWAHTIGGVSNDRSQMLVVDNSGNIYVAGDFTGAVDFDPGPGFAVHTNTYPEFFIAKYDSAGNFLWVKTIKTIVSQYSQDILTLDNAGNILITGSFQGTKDFDPDSLNTFYMTALNNRDIFICKIDNNGQFLWAKSMGGNGPCEGWGVATDSNNSVFTTGNFLKTIDFDPDSAITYNLTSAGGQDIFISKLDSLGNFIWAESFEGYGYSGNPFLAIDAFDNIYVTGEFGDTLDFDPALTSAYSLTSSGLWDAFICKLDNSGNFKWAHAYGGINMDAGQSIKIGSNGGIYTSGKFQGSVDFNPDSTAIDQLTSYGDYDIFVHKSDSAGNLIWAKQIGGPGSEYANSIALDDADNVYATGHFSMQCDFNPDTAVTNSIVSIGGFVDLFLSSLDSNGIFKWVTSGIGGIEAEAGSAVVIDNNNKLIFTGWYFSNELTLGPITMVKTPNPSFTSCDFFIAKTGSLVTGIEKPIQNIDCMIYPNPAFGHFTVMLSSSHNNAAISITDLTGSIIRKETFEQTNELTVSVRDLDAGVYMVKVEGDSFVEMHRVVVMK